MRKIVKLECDYGHRGFYYLEGDGVCSSVRYYFMMPGVCNSKCKDWEADCSIRDTIIVYGSRYLLLNENEN